MRRTNKHQVQKISFGNLVGGINVAQPPEQIAENEMQQCVNMWYDRDSMRLVGRGGLQKVSTFDSGGDIKSMYYDIDTNTTFVFMENRDAYSVTLSSTENNRKYIDKVTGTSIAKCCKFKDKLFVASKGLLQFYDFGSDNTLQTITSSPICDLLFYRFGRLAVGLTDSDRITYSSTGDATSEEAWTEDTNDSSLSQWIDIGYDDSGNIIDIVPLATDLIIFKSNGKAYQFTGDNDTSSWAVYNVSNFTDLTQDFVSGMSATNIGNEVVFLSLRGLKTLSTTQDYGNIATTDIGAKFNKLVTRSLSNPKMWNLRRHKTLLIQPTSEKKYIVAFNYGLNAATVLNFAFPITEVLETKDDVFIASGNSVYRWTDEAVDDDGTPINYMVMPKTTIGNEELLLKAIDVKCTSDHAGTAVVAVNGKLKANFPTNNRHKVRCNHSHDAMALVLESNDRFELDHIILDVADL